MDIKTEQRLKVSKSPDLYLARLFLTAFKPAKATSETAVRTSATCALPKRV